ncbi:MAG: [Fe-S]-binding protein [Gammaproteobacteria bacterium RIFCSPHIGHO2_12_FULL_45_12]|nr:MAG: [Fe-S]-binding protein [Gammaproteobacteria bacterium RIFCSPHIGHO2_12_FULL_45_12]
MRHVTPDEIDQLLPQTQCELCGFGGCMPYAKALAQGNAPINLCPPGGIPTLKALGQLLDQDPTPYLHDLQQKTPAAKIAVIREADCIGCTKCLPACPVDAIIGSAKQMHAIITAECTGCELCVAPCPVDCIDIITLSPETKQREQSQKTLSRKRHAAKQERATEALAAKKQRPSGCTLTEKQLFIREAVTRAKARKKALSTLYSH